MAFWLRMWINKNYKIKNIIKKKKLDKKKTHRKLIQKDWKKRNKVEKTNCSNTFETQLFHCGRFSRKQTDFLWIHLFHKHNKHFLKECCFSHGSEERKTHGATWLIASCITRHGWDGCSAMTSSPKPFHFLNALHSVQTWQHMSTPRNWSSWQEHIGFDTHETVPHIWGTDAWADIDICWWPPHDTHFHTIHQSNPPSFTLLKQWACHAELLGFFFGVNKCLNVFSCNHGGLFQRCSFFSLVSK